MTGLAELPAGLVGSRSFVDTADTAAEVMIRRAVSAVDPRGWPGLFERATSPAGRPWEESPDLDFYRT